MFFLNKIRGYITIFCICSSAYALTLAKLSDTVLIQNATSIVYGTIETVTTEKINNKIFTRYTVNISKDGMIKKGIINSMDTASFYMIGGCLESECLDIPGLIKLAKGKKYVLFLEKAVLGMTIFGSNQGVYPVVIDPITGISIVAKKSDPEVYGTAKSNEIKQVNLDLFIKNIKAIGGY